MNTQRIPATLPTPERVNKGDIEMRNGRTFVNSQIDVISKAGGLGRGEKKIYRERVGKYYEALYVLVIESQNNWAKMNWDLVRTLGGGNTEDRQVWLEHMKNQYRWINEQVALHSYFGQAGLEVLQLVCGEGYSLAGIERMRKDNFASRQTGKILQQTLDFVDKILHVY